MFSMTQAFSRGYTQYLTIPLSPLVSFSFWVHVQTVKLIYSRLCAARIARFMEKVFTPLRLSWCKACTLPCCLHSRLLGGDNGKLWVDGCRHLYWSLQYGIPVGLDNLRLDLKLFPNLPRSNIGYVNMFSSLVSRCVLEGSDLFGSGR